GQHAGLLGFAVSAVGAVLDQFHVVVGERPEEGFGDVQGAGVVVVLERALGVADDRGQAGQQRVVQAVDDHGGVVGEHVRLGGAQVQHELRRVQDLDGQASAD